MICVTTIEFSQSPQHFQKQQKYKINMIISFYHITKNRLTYHYIYIHIIILYYVENIKFERLFKKCYHTYNPIITNFNLLGINVLTLVNIQKNIVKCSETDKI